MKKVLVVHHASHVTTDQLQSFINQIPEVVLSEHEIRISEFKKMPENLITATPKTMKERGWALINKKSR